MKRLILPLLALTTVRSMPALEDKCNGICGRRPLAPSHSNPFPVVGGVNSLPGAWPWMVSIRIPSKAGFQHTCGGSLIGATWVMTAAHCFKDKRHLTNWELVLGATHLSRPGPDAEVRFPKRVVEHAEYQPYHQTNDIALIELDEPVLCNDYIQPACLPDDSVNVSTMSHCYVAGWGFTHEKSKMTSDILKEAKVDLISVHKCNSTNWYYGSITDNNLCAGFEGGGIDTCQGDSGGPLMCRESRSERFWAVGITSWGMGCARVQKPGVYTSTQLFYDWIQSYTTEEPVSEASPLPQSSEPTPVVQTVYVPTIVIQTLPETSIQTETASVGTVSPPPSPETQTLPPPPTTSQMETSPQPEPPPSPPVAQSQPQGADQSEQRSVAETETPSVPTTAAPPTPQTPAPPPKPPKRKHTVISSVQWGSRWSPKWPSFWPSNRQSNTQN
ncbi:acrosin [Sceloporus undulatus]|uniref:acrosin n=1 Tax=Sceloporus undulatus TaxID=8520 RepID=UPI001C4D649F|nr:acrosin [Sceloporus undulatus]